ncbi:MAG: alanine--tRNA ligase [Candidatus Sungbacteria bacterium]|nr:alanine--tRNA ligase [Candidatus Sungbacteria bacterium]
MDSSLIRQKFLSFFQARNHAVVPSSSLVPDDPSVLLTTAGMQQFKKYYTEPDMADRDFGSRNTASIQKSFRTSDIDEVGDESHLTIFEMLGNISFGGYFKEKAIALAHEFLTKEMGLDISYVSVFEGSDAVPKDEESKKIWQSLGMSDIREQGMEDVFWGPTGTSGPCGPTTEIYCKNGANEDIEVWNIVFNEFFCDGSREDLLAGRARLAPLPTKGIDTGMGLERLAMVSQGTNTIFETDLFVSFCSLADVLPRREWRIVADHLRGAVFLIADGVRPSNKDRGYVLRRLMRRALTYAYLYQRDTAAILGILDEVVCSYDDMYEEVGQERDAVQTVFQEEWAKFEKTLGNGIKELNRLERIDAVSAFHVYETFGLPFEIIKELGKEKASGLAREDFDREFTKHQKISRAGQEKKFGGHGLILDTGELRAGDEEELKKVTRLHTATHLLNAALRAVLGPNIRQQGSDITPERTRFDFAFSRKLTDEEKKKIEEWVNGAIRRDLAVEYREMPYDEAVASGAIRFWRDKYPSRVKVYSIFDSKTGEMISKELCGGPHVARTGEIGHFKIIKEESSSAGVRRIRATI